MKTPDVGTVLTCEDGSAIVVADGTDNPTQAILDLVVDGYGGPPFPVANPAIAAAADKARIEVWRSCTKAWRDAEGVDDTYTDYFAPDGDGRRAITVVYVLDDIYDLGERALEAEQAT